MVNIRNAARNRSAPRRSLEAGRNIPHLRAQPSANHYRARFGTVMTLNQIAANPVVLTVQGSLNRKERRALRSSRGV